MRGYLIAMIVRVICIVTGVYVSGWLMWVCFAGAIFLPYFAVVFANAAGEHKGKSATTVTKQAPAIKVSATEFKIMDGDTR
jgi:predicted tellurium resistance membrane protein TerC